MALDPSIALAFRPPRVRNPLEVAAQGAQLEGTLRRNQLADLQMQQLEQAGADEAAGQQALREFYGSDRGPDAQRTLATRSPKAFQAERKRQVDEDKDRAATESSRATAQKAQLDVALAKIGVLGQSLQDVKDQETYDKALGLMAQVFPNDVGMLPRGYDPKVVEIALNANLKRADYLLNERGKLDAAERERHHREMERVARQRENREATAPRGQVVQSDQGTMLVDPRAGTAQPVVGPGGQPLRPALKAIPANQANAIAENSAALQKIDDALAELGRRPQGLGVKNYFGDTIRQRTDPEGVKLRALVADIGSLKIHDRSGAAVTAAEFPRLRPFIPSATDDPDVVRTKLQNFRREYELVQNDLRDTYSESQGYRPSPVLQRGGSGMPRVSNDAEYNALPSGTEYIAPDGKARRKR